MCNNKPPIIKDMLLDELENFMILIESSEGTEVDKKMVNMALTLYDDIRRVNKEGWECIICNTINKPEVKVNVQ